MNNKQRLQKLYNESTININGEITPAHQAKISIFDRGFLYGDSIYEVTYSQDNSLLFFNEHLERLFESARIINLNIFIDRDTIIKESLKTLKASKIKDAYIRIIITRGETEITLDPNSSFKNNFVIIVKPKPTYPQEYYSKGMKLALVTGQQKNLNTQRATAKSGNYLSNVMAISEAKHRDFDDAVMTNMHGKVTEGTTFNIWMVKDKTIYTPPVDSGLLKGITREKVLEICSKHKLKIKVENFSPEDLLNAEEVFITSSTKGVMPIYQINDNIYGEGVNEWPVIKNLTDLYRKLVKSTKCEKEYYYG